MVRITEELVRKRAEHNECEICTLEEIALHQEDIEKIEHLQNWCRDLEILLLQNNLISRIENVYKFKKLKYLNLALNNIEVIENLERCESLEKLDLTVNFIGNLESVCSLKNNYNLEHLYLTGNPCTDYKSYRSYVITKLPQIKCLDNTDILRSERIKALMDFNTIEKEIREEQEVYKKKREEQKIRLTQPKEKIPDEEFWKLKSEHAPEVRIEIANRVRRAKGKEASKEKKEEFRQIKFFAKDGRPYNINQAKIDFKFIDDNPKEYILDVDVYKFMDTNLLDVDLQPNYVRVLIKGKILQLALPKEICTSKSMAQRSQTTGHLVITMPILDYKPPISSPKPLPKMKHDSSNDDKRQRREYLEIGTDKLSQLFNLVENNKKEKEFIDNPEVPPLE